MSDLVIFNVTSRNNNATNHFREQFWRPVLDAYKAHKGCAMCGFRNERGSFFDFDHIDPDTKEMPISWLLRRCAPDKPEHIIRLMTELEKCQILCVACHRDKTATDHSKRTFGVKRTQ